MYLNVTHELSGNRIVASNYLNASIINTLNINTAVSVHPSIDFTNNTIHEYRITYRRLTESTSQLEVLISVFDAVTNFQVQGAEIIKTNVFGNGNYSIQDLVNYSIKISNVVNLT